MNAIVNFDFEGHGIRTVMREEMPWFVAADICRVLGIGNPAETVRRLDDDEKGIISTDTLGGTQDVVIVSESGLYTIVLRCRDAVKQGSAPHRFRKWVTADVLPALRKHGTYSMPPSVPRPVRRSRYRGGLHPAEVSSWAYAVQISHRVHGRDGAQSVWDSSPLPPVPPKRLESLLRNWTGLDALRHLMDLDIGNGTLGELVGLALGDRPKRKDMEEYGVRILDLTEGPVMMVADDHHFLRKGFEGTDICYAWNDWLRKLPGAYRAKKPMMIDNRMRRGVLLPLSVVMGE